MHESLNSIKSQAASYFGMSEDLMEQLFTMIEERLKAQERELKELRKQIEKMNKEITKKELELRVLKDEKTVSLPDEELQRACKVLDRLFRKLPDRDKNEFVNSDDFMVYHELRGKAKPSVGNGLSLEGLDEWKAISQKFSKHISERGEKNHSDFKVLPPPPDDDEESLTLKLLPPPPDD